MLFVIIFIVLYVINPIKDLIDFRRIIGIDSMYGENYTGSENDQEEIEININPNSDNNTESTKMNDPNSEHEASDPNLESQE